MMSRRAMGFGLAFGLAPFLLDCTAQQSADVAHVSTDLQAIVTGFTTALGQVGSLISPADQQILATALANLKLAAADVAKAATAAAAQAPVSQAMTYIATFAAGLSGFNLPQTVAVTVGSILAAAQTLIPIIAANVGIAAGTPAAPKMTESQAVAILTRSHEY